MARPLRIEFPNAVHHVTARGNARGAIARDAADREKWLSILADTVSRRRWRLFAFALLGNHFHLFLQTPEASLSEGMHDLCGTYAGYLNRRHGRSGHVFQGRFKAVLVEEQGHWLELSRYVHLNPVRAGLARRPEDWLWSSYRGYHRAAHRVPWVDYEQVLEEFGGDGAAARRAYRTFMEEGLGRRLDSPLGKVVAGVALGSEAFLARVRGLLAGRRDDAELPELTRLRRAPSIETVSRAVAERYGADAACWRPGRRHDDVSRAVAAYLARRLTRERLGAIALALGYRRASSVAMACRRVERALADPRVSREVRTLEESLLAID